MVVPWVVVAAVSTAGAAQVSLAGGGGIGAAVAVTSKVAPSPALSSMEICTITVTGAAVVLSHRALAGVPVDESEVQVSTIAQAAVKRLTLIRAVGVVAFTVSRSPAPTLML